MTITVVPRHPALGAEIRGIDMRRPMDPETFKAVHDAWMKHLVVVFPDQPVTEIRTMEEHLAGSVSQTRLTTMLLAVFSLIALIVAMVGLYGLISYSVAQRTQELGIRLALGAGRGAVLRLVMRQGLILAVSGVILGVGGSYGLTRLMRSLLYGVSATDVWTFTICALLFIAIALLASFVPARRASQLDPAEALRTE